MSIKWHQSQFALHFQPLSNQGISEMCVCNGMCVVVMRVLSSPWCGPESFVWALQHDSKLVRSQRIICPKHCFITTEYLEFPFHFQN